MSETRSTRVQCSHHGLQDSAIVCRHIICIKDKAVGFVENSSDPLDLQAWCDECEACFLEEGDMTEAFRKFNDFAVVCVQCYDALRQTHVHH